MSQRTERVDELLREEIGAILARDVADPRIGFATVTDVETTSDLRHARVWVSIIGTEADRQATLGALRHAMGFVQRELGHRLRLKRIPALHVELDDTAQRGTRVLRLLEELQAGHVPDDLPDGETLPTPVARIGREGDAQPLADEVEADAAADPASGSGATADGAPTSGRSRQARTRRGEGPRVRTVHRTASGERARRHRGTTR